MSRGYERNARLSRAAVLTAAGGAFISVTQQPEIASGPWATGGLAVGGLIIAGALAYAVMTFLPHGDDR
ncbi:hypothetical protein [Phenylobacterium immobile]|uniref:hypothetical protein n=1 Tax=Phenylobacterium immobile TaxID=21 RepID=UPI000B0A3145|nr:hypothetical protein [Phenylobacterium immobile]